MPSTPTESPEKEIIKAFEAAGVVDYLQYLQSNRKIMWTSFLSGISKGFGIVIGMTLVLTVFIWILAKMVALPVIGEYFQQAESYVEEYMEKTNYIEEFQEMNQLLREIRDNSQRE
jgi:hypothetical protein